MSGADLRFAEVDGYSIAYREAGRGAGLVLLHGFVSDSRCWRHQLSGLSDQFRVVAWDAPGAGSSSDPPDTFTTESYARCLTSFLDTIGITRAHVVGLSWGGILAQEFYRLYPERLGCLVLADTYAGWKGSLPEPVWRERLATCLHDAAEPPDTLVAKFLPGMFTDAVSLHAAIPGAQLAIIPNAGHVSYMEQPGAFNAHVRRFCLERARPNPTLQRTGVRAGRPGR